MVITFPKHYWIGVSNPQHDGDIMESQLMRGADDYNNMGVEKERQNHIDIVVTDGGSV